MAFKMYKICNKKVLGAGTEHEKTIWPEVGFLKQRTEEGEDDRFFIAMNDRDTEYYCFPFEPRRKNEPDF